jgi:hypothetical protein
VTSSLNGRKVLAILAILWAAMVLWDFGLPGLHVDEANQYAFAPGILSEKAARLHHYRLPDNWLDRLDGVSQFPIVGGSLYNSDYRPYLAIPFFSTVGFSVESLRLFSGLIGLAAVLSAATLTARLFSWTPALLLGLILVTDPTTVFSLRSQGGAYWLVILFSALAAHALLSAYRRPDKPLWLPIAAGASIAMAVHSYFVGVYLAVPLVICGISTFWRQWSRLAALLAAGVIVYSPVFYAIISIYLTAPEQLATFGVPKHALTRPMPVLSLDNLDRFWTLMQASIGRFIYTQGVVGHFNDAFSPLRLASIGIAGAALAVAWFKTPKPEQSQRGFYVTAAAAVGLSLLGAFVLKGTDTHHIIPLATLLFLLVASLASQSAPLCYVAFVACGLLIFTNTVSLFRAHRSLNETGGLAYHNEAYSVPAQLFRTTFKDYHPVFASWGSHLQFLFQTAGTVPYSFVGAPSANRINRLAQQQGKVAIIIGVRERQALGGLDGRVITEMHFSQRNGLPLFDIILLDANQAR